MTTITDICSEKADLDKYLNSYDLISWKVRCEMSADKPYGDNLADILKAAKVRRITYVQVDGIVALEYYQIVMKNKIK